ncbi:hypothetical protein Dimus_038487 [Dionaea muscipula]
MSNLIPLKLLLIILILVLSMELGITRKSICSPCSKLTNNVPLLIGESRSSRPCRLSRDRYDRNCIGVSANRRSSSSSKWRPSHLTGSLLRGWGRPSSGLSAHHSRYPQESRKQHMSAPKMNTEIRNRKTYLMDTGRRCFILIKHETEI